MARSLSSGTGTWCAAPIIRAPPWPRAISSRSSTSSAAVEMGPALTIRPAEMRDSTAYVEHVISHMAESGKNGAPIFAPGHRPQRDEVRENTEGRWAKRLQDPVWGRSWVLETSEHRIVGHVDLRGGRIAPEMHRATLGMGIEQTFTGKGYN